MKPVTPRLHVETLEGRDCPSTIIGLTNDGHTLVIKGTQGPDTVQIVQDDTNDTLTVTRTVELPPDARMKAPTTLVTDTYKSSTITKVVVHMWNTEDDVFSYRLAEGTDYTNGKVFAISMGSGNNTIDFDIGSLAATEGTGTSAGDVISDSPSQTNSVIKSFLKLAINTGDGNDQVTVNLGEIAEKIQVGVQADLGAGDDNFSLSSSGTIHKASKLWVDVDGGSGNDNIYTGLFGDVQETGYVDVALRGGSGQDQINVDQMNALMGRITVRAWGGLDDDVINVNSGNLAGSSGILRVQEFGNEGNDTLCLNAWSPLASSVKLVDCLLEGGAGNDTARITQKVPMTSIEAIDYLAMPYTPVDNSGGQSGKP